MDFRAQQCAEYNSKPFRGWYYKWKPYTKVDGKFGPFGCLWGLCAWGSTHRTTQEFRWIGHNYFMDQEAQNVSLFLSLPRGCIFPSIRLCKRKTDVLYSFCKDIISPENKQYIPWIKMTSRGFLGIDGTRKETTLFRVRMLCMRGNWANWRQAFSFSYLCRCYTFCKLIVSLLPFPLTATAVRDKNLEETITLCNIHGRRVTTCTFWHSGTRFK